MLVTNVSMLPRRGPLSVTIIEAVAAVDTPAIGSLIFPALVDDPASAIDIVNGYLGEIMIEAASAAATADAGLAYAVSVDEAATATSTQDGAFAGAITGTIDEAATATSTQDATVTGAVTVRSAMLPDVFVNADTSREANVGGIMVNI